MSSLSNRGLVVGNQLSVGEFSKFRFPLVSGRGSGGGQVVRWFPNVPSSNRTELRAKFFPKLQLWEHLNGIS